MGLIVKIEVTDMPEKQVAKINTWCDRHQKYSYTAINRNPFWKKDLRENFLDTIVISEFLDDQRVHPYIDPEEMIETLHKKFPEENNDWWLQEHDTALKEMLNWIHQNQFAHFSDLLRYAITAKPEWLTILCTDKRQQFWFSIRKSEDARLRKKF